MFHLRWMAILAAALVAAASSPDEFSQERAMDHIRALAALKSRTAGTAGESAAIQYASEQLRQFGLEVSTEPFEFRSYQLDQATLRVSDLNVQPAQVMFDPYREESKIQGNLGILAATGSDLSPRIVVTTKEAPYSRLFARAIVFVSDPDFEKLKAAGPTRAELLLNGRLTTMKSANLVAATRNRDAQREIILSAHIDSAGTPGAQDNASGVAVLLELARTLPKLNLPFRVRFVFFGAEEVGLIGSQAYVARHREDLKRCEFVFNMDSVGGKDIYIDMRDGVRNVPGDTPLEPLPKANRDFQGRWDFIGAAPMAPDSSNVPTWLQNAILDSARRLGYEINQSRGASSDHRTFTNVGIVATDIVAGGLKSHTPEDVPEQIIPATLEKVARIVTGVVVAAKR